MKKPSRRSGRLSIDRSPASPRRNGGGNLPIPPKVIVRELTRNGIEAGLRRLGLKEGVTVEVHSSLSSFGNVQGGAVTVVDALMSVVGKTGSLLMSNYPLALVPLTPEERAKGIGWKLRKIPENSDERTVTGAVSDEFRFRADVVCGSGIHRVCAWGRDAELHAKGYRHLLEVDGLVLLLGVGIDRCSSMHLAEEVKITRQARERMNALWPDTGSKITDAVRREYSSDIFIGPREGEAGGPWENARHEAERRGLIERGEIGQAACLLFRARDLVALIEEVRKSGPFPVERQKKC